MPVLPSRPAHPEQVERDYGRGCEPQDSTQGGVVLQSQAQPDIEDDHCQHKQQNVGGDSDALRGCLQSLELVLNLMNEPQIVPQRPDGRTVGDPRPPTPTSQTRRPAPYSGPAGGSDRHPVFAGADAPGGWSRTICLPGRPCTSTSAVGPWMERGNESMRRYAPASERPKVEILLPAQRS